MVAKFYKDMEIIADAEKKALDTYMAKEFSQKMLNSDNFGPEQNVMIKDKDEESQISKVDKSSRQSGEFWNILVVAKDSRKIEVANS